MADYDPPPDPPLPLATRVATIKISGSSPTTEQLAAPGTGVGSASASSAPRFLPPADGTLEFSWYAAEKHGMNLRDFYHHQVCEVLSRVASDAGLTIQSAFVASWLLVYMRPATLAVHLAARLKDYNMQIPSATWLIDWLCTALANEANYDAAAMRDRYFKEK